MPMILPPPTPTAADLRAFRDRWGMTSAAPLAAALGIHFTTLDGYESGRVPIPPHLGLALADLARELATHPLRPITPAAIAAERRRLGLSQQELAVAFGLAVATIARWERRPSTPGHRHGPPPYVWRLFAELERRLATRQEVSA